MNVGSGVSTWGRWDRPSIAALIAWGMALVVGAFIGDVSPMRGSAIALVGVVLVTPMLRAEARVAVVAVFGGLLLVPGHGSPFLWLLLVVAVILRWGDRVRLRVTWAAAGALCVFGVFPFLGNTTLGEMGAVALGGLLLGIGAPLERIGGVPVALTAAFSAAQGYQLQVAARTQPVDKIAPVVASRGAERLRPLLAARAANALRQGRHMDAVHVIAAFPSAHILGQSLARARGVPFAIDVGWRPREPVDPSMAREVAWALQDAGCPDLALAVLGSDPDLALHRALLVAEPGAGAALPLVVPEDVLTAPGLLISRDEILENEQIQVLFAVDESLSSVRMEATGQPFLGPPELTLSVAGEEVATVEVPEDLGSWTFDRPLRRGVYRLALAYTNDHYNESGNRNVYRVRVWVE